MTEARTPIPAGDYVTGKVPGSQRRRVRFHVALQPDGMTRITGAERGRGEDLAGFVPLGSGGHFYIMWVVSLNGDTSPPRETIYGLLELRAAGRYRLYLPNCDFDGDQPVAVAAGAQPTADHRAFCRFLDRASLEAAFAAYARRPGEGMEIIPAGRE